MAIRNYLRPSSMRNEQDITARPPDDPGPTWRIGPRQFWAIFEHARDAMWIVDEAQRIVAANPAACALCGLPRAELLRHRFVDLLAHETALAFQRAWQSLPGQGQFDSAVQFLYGDRAPRDAEITATANFLPGQHLLVARDITEQKWALAQVDHQQARLAALRVVGRTRATSRDLRGTLDTILAQITEQLQVDAAAVLLLHAPSATLTYTTTQGLPLDLLSQVRLPADTGYAGQAVQQQRLVYIPDLAAATHLLPAVLGAGEGFATYYAVPLVANEQVQGVLEIFHRTPLHLPPDDMEFLAALADQAAITIDNAGLFRDLQHFNQELGLAYETTLEGWSRALDLRDRETEGHTQRVTELTVRLAHALGVRGSDLIHIRRGALLHDIGKMGIPDAILLKPGPLTEEEWTIMRRHPVYAYDLLAPITFLRPALPIPFYHHERWDGSGYPHGLCGSDIPWAARIFAVVDVWDALCSDRPYRPAWPPAQVRAHIQALAGIHFDPTVVAAFMESVLPPP
jgi:PAS domain S-box-containing protein